MIQKQIKLKNGVVVHVREAKTDDTDSLIQYLEKVSGESDFLTIGPGDFKLSVEEEKEFIKKMNKSKNSLFLVAVINEEIVGIFTFEGGGNPRTKHVGDFGITVLKNYWGLGIGSILIEMLLNWVKKSKTVRKINLKVDTNNTRAISVYEKFGFKKEGEVSRDSFINGKFNNAYIMGLEID